MATNSGCNSDAETAVSPTGHPERTEQIVVFDNLFRKSRGMRSLDFGRPALAGQPTLGKTGPGRATTLVSFRLAPTNSHLRWTI
jgi:hypothetical protein